MVKSKQEIKLLRASGAILGNVLGRLRAYIAPGVTTKELDTLAITATKKAGATPAFLGYRGFPGALCVSINEEVVHGIPKRDRVLRSGDIVTVDMGVEYKGWNTDAAITVPVGEVSAVARDLIAVTQQALTRGIDAITVGKRLGAYGAAVQRFTEKKGYGVVRELVGHGIGKEIHEDPQIPNYGKSDSGPIVQEGMILALEPMITVGGHAVEFLDDGWTVSTRDGSLAAHFEHTVAIVENGVEILTVSNE